jgi:hypothetical protein|tara:strand:+ start:392 stop:505 length:114 start_codon:yes stop_codon:yes gene_type:complete
MQLIPQVKEIQRAEYLQAEAVVAQENLELQVELLQVK